MKSKLEIIEKVNNLLETGFEIPKEKLQPSARLYEDLALDSLDAVDMLVHLEDNLGVKVQGERFMQVRTLGDIHEMVAQMVWESENSAGQCSNPISEPEANLS